MPIASAELPEETWKAMQNSQIFAARTPARRSRATAPWGSRSSTIARARSCASPRCARVPAGPFGSSGAASVLVLAHRARLFAPSHISASEKLNSRVGVVL
jgi:hypothetical protein